MRSCRIDLDCSRIEQSLRRLDQRACSVDDVVDDQARSSLHIADHVHHLSHVQIRAPLVHDGQRSLHLGREKPRPFHSARVRRNHRKIGQVQLPEVAHHHRAGEHVIDRDIKESLNLRRMQIHEQCAVGSRSGQQIRHQLGRDRHPRTILTVLPRVPVVRHYHRDPSGRSALQRVNHDQQFDQVLIHRKTSRLHDKDVHSPDVLQQLKINLSVGETLQLTLAQLYSDVRANALSQFAVGRTGEDLEPLVFAQTPSALTLRFHLTCCCQLLGYALYLLLRGGNRQNSGFSLHTNLPSWFALVVPPDCRATECSAVTGTTFPESKAWLGD